MPSPSSPRPCRRAYDIFNPQYPRGNGHGSGESQSQSFLMNTTYTFLAETDHNGVKTVNAASTTTESLADLVQSFEYFLKGAGFYFHSLEVHTNDPEGQSEDS